MVLLSELVGVMRLLKRAMVFLSQAKIWEVYPTQNMKVCKL